MNDWVRMLAELYGNTQNYSKSSYEILSHLTEVCGAFAKHCFKRKDFDRAREFLPKIFSWTVALYLNLYPNSFDLEETILRKFPGVCPYCLNSPCVCWRGEKPSLQPERLRDAYYNQANRLGRTVNDLQLMFREIYEDSWHESSSAQLRLAAIYVRLTEELAEVAEAVRFHHLYPENFRNELADLLVWWFALSTCIIGSSESNSEPQYAEDLLWRAYPATCNSCAGMPCICRPGPVRELMSAPTPGQKHRFDAPTSALNHGALLDDIAAISKGVQLVPVPMVLVRVDVDDFKAVNESRGHAAGDAALRHIVSLFQRTIRERDKFYRAGGDEFALILPDFTSQEALGLMERALGKLRSTPVRWVSNSGQVLDFVVTTSIGLSQCDDAHEVGRSFEEADAAAGASKRAGKNRVTAH